MLNHLTLKDFAVVSGAELAFADGLTVVSGETGAGKSLLVDALLWLTGARADAGVVRHGAERAELTAEFGLGDAPDAAAWLDENALDEDGACQLRRVIRADGGSRAWINGRPATLAQLSQLGALLVEIHGQHEHQALLDRTHQLGQLDRESLDAAGIDEMLGSHRRQAHAADLLASYDAALTRLAGDDGQSLSRGLHQVQGDLSRHVDNEPRLAEIASLLESAGIALDEATSALERLRDDLDLDPAHLVELESRMARLHDLARKHRVPLSELAPRRDAMAAELDSLRGAGERSERLLTERAAAAARWTHAAAELSKARAKTAKALGKAVSALMAELGMGGGVFAVELTAQDAAKPHALGAERCEFLVSANPGQPPRALRKVASGGELARISLAIEVAALGLDAVPTMIFDEVDTGIGGAVAEVVGQKLRALGDSRQVLCVTHLPQVAAQGHHHFQVSKASNGTATHSAVSVLDDKARIEELARMLGGVEITRETRANAKQMLSRAQG